jgi:ribosomal protein S18 acetylase RimI-like enzyme
MHVADSIKIRRLAGKDLVQVEDIQRTILKKNISSAWYKNAKAHFEKAGIVGFVAEIDKKVIGYIIGESMGFSFGIEKSGWIEGVSVIPQYMGTGIGKRLANKMFEHFKKMGIVNIYSAVKWDTVDMLSFFKSVGFNRSDFITLGKHLE